MPHQLSQEPGQFDLAWGSILLKDVEASMFTKKKSEKVSLRFFKMHRWLVKALKVRCGKQEFGRRALTLSLDVLEKNVGPRLTRLVALLPPLAPR